jgi:hypothetical protein
MVKNLIYNSTEIEITIIADLYEEDQDVLIKSNVKRKETIYLDDIKAVGQVWDNNGRIESNRTYIQHVDLGRIVVQGKYRYFRDLKFPKLNKDNTSKTKVGYGRGD